MKKSKKSDMKLCLSTYTSLLVKGKAQTTKQVGLIMELFDCIPDFYKYNNLNDGEISDIVYGKKNAPGEAIEKAKQCDPRAVADSIKADFLKLLDNNKKGSIILALKDIVSKDQNLADDTKIEMVNGMTKAAFLNRDSFVYADLLAGLFLYVLIYTDNQGMRGEAKAITEEYLDSFRSKADDLSYLA